MPIDAQFKSIHHKEWEINFTHCDPNGKLKYPDLCNLLQLTAAEHAECGGISFTDMQAYNQAWVLSRMRIEIDSLPCWRDKISVKTWIVTLENSRSIRAMEVTVNGVKSIGVESVWAVFNTHTRRPENLALPHDHFEKFEQQRGTRLAVSKIEIPTEAQHIQTHRVQWSDLDIVNHVNNVKYLEWCLDANSRELQQNKRIAVLELNFLSELNLQEEVNIHLLKTKNAHTYSITKADKVCYLAQIEWI